MNDSRKDDSQENIQDALAYLEKNPTSQIGYGNLFRGVNRYMNNEQFSSSSDTKTDGKLGSFVFKDSVKEIDIHYEHGWFGITNKLWVGVDRDLESAHGYFVQEGGIFHRLFRESFNCPRLNFAQAYRGSRFASEQGVSELEYDSIIRLWNLKEWDLE